MRYSLWNLDELRHLRSFLWCNVCENRGFTNLGSCLVLLFWYAGLRTLSRSQYDSVVVIDVCVWHRCFELVRGYCSRAMRLLSMRSCFDLPLLWYYIACDYPHFFASFLLVFGCSRLCDDFWSLENRSSWLRGDPCVSVDICAGLLFVSAPPGSQLSSFLEKGVFFSIPASF